MRKVMGEKEYNIFELDSENELKELTPIKIFGLNSEVHNRFFIIEFDNNIKIGIINEDHGIDPQIKKISNELFVISSDKVAYYLNIDSLHLTEKELDSLIYNILLYQDVIILVCELDIYCFSNKFEENWHLALDDILNDYSVEDGTLKITTEEDEYLIELLSGKQILKN